MAKFTPEEIELLKNYVTNPTGSVFCITGMPGLVGAAYARYSRAQGGFREVLLKEFIKEGVVDSEHAEELIQRVLIAFGDDSVGELEGAHLSFENITMLAAKEMEECRIGGSPIEQSTRYVFLNQKNDEGNYKYYRDPKIMASKHGRAYVEGMNFFFDTYCRLYDPVKDWYKKRKPLEAAEYDVLGSGEKQHYAALSDPKDQKAFRVTYAMDIKTKTCDTLRYILPIATQTNVGWFGNGRFYQSLVSAMLSNPHAELQELARQAETELNKLIPAYVRRAKASEYQMANEGNMEKLALQLTANIEVMANEDEIDLVDPGVSRMAHLLADQNITLDAVAKALQEGQDHVTLAMMLYPYVRHSLRQLIEQVIPALSTEQKSALIRNYVGVRKTRRDRPYRAFESGYPYTFDLVTDFGVYKDIMRHRMTSQLRQKFSPLLGFVMPPDIISMGLEKDLQDCHERSVELYKLLLPDFPHSASYATLHGSKMRWTLSFNDREAFHLLELRTTPQGHPMYRRLCQMMHTKIAERSPWRAELMSFVDHNDYDSARGDSEARQRVKERQLEERKK
ncbi:MAG: FAD-dependent thymidylate synthase [bacterium]|nr:FAD-dependent thymidylate synthase [bacterium]